MFLLILNCINKYLNQLIYATIRPGRKFQKKLLLQTDFPDLTFVFSGWQFKIKLEKHEKFIHCS